MRDGYVHGKWARARGPEHQVGWPIAGTSNGLLNFKGPVGGLGQSKQSVAQVFVAPECPIAWATQSMVTSGIHCFPATGTH